MKTTVSAIAAFMIIAAIAACEPTNPIPEKPDPDPEPQEEPEQDPTPTPTPVVVKIDTIDFNIENAEAMKYMDYVYAHPYRTSDFSATYIEDYYKKPRSNGYRGDCPAGYEIKWDSVLGATSYRITISENEDMSDPVRTATTTSRTLSYTVTNMIPGHSYHCTVRAQYTDEYGTDIRKAFIRAGGRRRMIKAESVGNVRDLGGLCTEDGKHTRYGLLYRGSRLNAQGITISNEDTKEFLNLGIRADLDLRQDESGKLGDCYTTRKSPLGSDVDWQLFPKANDSYFAQLRKNDEYIKAFQWMIDELKAGKPVYFHCKTGADRTGTLAFLIESLLGVTETDKSIDFELTSFFYDFGDPKDYAFRSRSISRTIAITGKEKYDWEGMYNLIDDYYTGTTYQQKVYNYLNKGIGTSSSARISTADLDWFIGHMLE